MNKPIRNIIFDLGNVVIRLAPEHTIKQFQSLGISDFDSIYTLMKQSEIFDRFDTGKITPVAFREAIRQYAGLPLSDRQIDDAWCAMLLDFPDENIALLRKLRTRYKLFILSNTNQIHIDRYLDMLCSEKGTPLLPDLFDHTYYSHEIGYRKPDKAAFEYVLHAENLKAAETVYIDDLEHNVTGARKVGLQAYHFLTGTRLTDLFISVAS
ncbi:MAG: HAD family phosphatase [Bacteroidales bacterium]|nr:HAD family phosphatase [Bacteroidales bacterium]